MRNLWIVVVLAALLGLPAASRAQAQSVLSSASALVGDGRWLAWASSVRPAGSPEPRTVINAREVATGRQITIADNLPASTVELSLGAGTLAYRTGPGSFTAVRLADGARRTIERERVARLAATGEALYWWEPAEPGGSARLFTTGLGGGEATLLSTVGFTPYGFGLLRASEGWVAWTLGAGNAKATVCYQLQAVSARGGDVLTIADLGCGLPQFDLGGSQLLYVDRDGMLVRQDLDAGTSVRSGPHCDQVTGTAGTFANCRTLTGFSSDGRYAYWAKMEPADAPSRADFWGFDTATGSAFLVAADVPQDPSHAWPETRAAGGTLAWLARTAPGAAELRYGPTLASLPPAPEEGAAPGALFFAETRHSLGGEFRGFWERNGGLAVFGYPLTREFIQESRDDGRGYGVQYFERQRFELHPENAGTPYLVQIGRLGAEALAAAGRDWTRLPKASPATPHYFAATGQAIAPEFWDYWRSQGLDLGDPGVSEREALALWGYPLTPAAPETVPGGAVVLVQWFERARFEYHPANPAPYKVLLGRLAADQVDGFGWR